MTRLNVVRTGWRKSSYSGTGGAECVEVAAFRGGRGEGGGAPVEFAGARVNGGRSGGGGGAVALVRVVGVRDSKAPEGPALLLGAGEWWGLVERIKGGGLDLVR
ncbi:DUF397 domain-containing protein [Actinomadura yumaensis]|uniref:DUF397 domain-containing protein n=1 Tax=Actinomadura yumaensis TaxID=111807 RepID=A0ABW2CI57_9ACTN